MVELPAPFLERMKSQLGADYDSFLQSYSRPIARAIRVNLLKISEEEFERITPLALDGKVPWEQSGYYVNGEGLGRTVLHAAGAYYVQEPSAMCVVPELDVKAGERVLDLCAAPGGKSAQIAAAMQGRGVLVCNEIDFGRFDILRSNLERMGIKNALALNRSPQELAEPLEGYFDKILVDAPCSGEGMFKKEPNAIPEWNLENVRRCAERQKEILNCADKMLAGGGRLVYSTCTFAPEEDEEQIEGFLKAHPRYTLLKIKKLYPHQVRGEGHFCAVLQKQEGERRDLKLYDIHPPKRQETIWKLYRDWEGETLTAPWDGLMTLNFADAVYRLFKGAPDLTSVFPRHYTHRAGVYLGRLSPDGKRFEPSHTFAMCLKSDEVRHIEVDERTALQYLRGLTFDCDEREKGWRVVTYCGLSLGWCKAVGGVAKNHLPKGLRI